MMKFSLVVLTLGTLLLSSCKRDKVLSNIDPDCIDTVGFSTQILPLVNVNCTSCHDVGNSTGYTLTNHTNISNNAEAMLNAMQGTGGFQQMPQDMDPLPDSIIKKFDCWINQGKLNN